MLIYRLVLIILTPLFAVRFLIALIRGRESWRGLLERIGLGGSGAQAAPLIWVHGASLGELTAARAMIERMLARSDRLRVLITCNSYTAREMVRKWGLERLEVRLAPLDAPLLVWFFLRRWRPLAAVTLENELWPARTILAAREGIPVIVIGGRMSRKSVATWARFARLARKVMGAISVLYPLDGENAQRFVKLGLAPSRIEAPENLKASVRLGAPDAAELAQLRQEFARAATVLAASTHAGEEEVVLDAFAKARTANPALRLIIAPRHPERGDAIARLIEAAGLRIGRRSQGSDGTGCEVYLADTLGEMPLFYSLAAVTILGGSFVDKGGHTPVEPVQFGSAVIHGPHVSNHAEAYAKLAADEAVMVAQDAQELAERLGRLADEEALEAMAERATAALSALRPEQGDTERIIDRIGQLSHGKLGL